MTVTTYKWSVKKWHELIDTGVLEDKPFELLEGEIIEMSPEGIPHRQTNHKVVKYLRNLLNGLAEVYQSQPITLDNSEPQPDISIVRLPESIYDNHHPYPEDIYWLIEVRPRADERRKGTRTFEISNKTLKIDKEKKSQTYARNGIPEYWIIDLVNKKLIVHTLPVDNQYSQVVEIVTGTIAPKAFPKVIIDSSNLLLF